MKYIRRITVAALCVLALWQPCASAQTPVVPTPDEVGKALGFTEAEIGRIKGGEIITKDLKEGSDKELAGVLAVFLDRPVKELVDLILLGRELETDKSMLAFRVWTPDASADEVFADAGLAATETAEAKKFASASPGATLNLSAAEIAQFQHVQPEPDAVNVPLRALLKARYEAYRKSGLKGITPYAREGGKESSPASELTLALNETKAVARRQDFFEALLNYPADALPGTEERFYWFKHTVEDRPTFILAHRTELRGENAALLTEEQFYVGHSYNSNVIAGGLLEVQGGTLVFYVNRTFTDQVAGMGSGMKHGIGRGQMLSQIAENLQHIRDQLRK